MKNTLKKISESDLYPDKAYYDLLGDSHVLHNINTPIRPDAFTLTDDEKIAQIELHFKAIMEILGLDLNDDSLCGTPYRVAKMYVKEFFQGLHPENKPSVTLFENTYNYKEILIERNISFHSNCEHHFVPITGKAHVAYIPKDKIIGLMLRGLYGSKYLQYFDLERNYKAIAELLKNEKDLLRMKY